MNIFSFAYIVILIIGFLCNYTENGKKYFCISSGVIYFLIAALRSSQVGGDSYNYRNMFEIIDRFNFKEIILTSKKDPIFFAFLKILRNITDNYSVLFAIVAGFFTVTVWMYIYKYSEDAVLSVIVLLAFNLYQFSLTGMRQTIAMGFVVLAIMAVYENKKLFPYIFIILGGLFHSSALLFLVIPIMRHIRMSTKVLRIMGGLLIVCFFLRGYIAGILVQYVAERGYDLSLSNSGKIMMIVIGVLFGLALLFINEYAECDKNYCVQYYMGWLAVFFEILVTSQNIFFRLAFYFLISFIILIPNIACRAKNPNSRLILKTGLYVVLSIQYLFFTIGSCYVLPYSTFWQI